MRVLLLAGLLASLMGQRLRAQHEGMPGMAMSDSGATRTHVMAQGIPLFSYASPAAGGVSKTQALLTQTLVMLRSASTRWAVDATLNAEGLFMAEGELNTGASGEGFVDKRHPHTYVHELMASALSEAGPARASVSGGRGFAAFGTDDPMMRPLEKYPLDHHLAQILERAVLTGALRLGPAILEGSTFDGDEPTHPSSLPNMGRFGDSWSARATWVASRATELQASYARVASPEQRDGFGLDQRKQSVSIRSASRERGTYLLAELARTTERDHGRNEDVFSYAAALVEGSARIGSGLLALRVERTERPEEERLADPFRTPRPASDLSIGGITRWTVVTIHVDLTPSIRGPFSGTPFVEGARLWAAADNPVSLLSPQRLYGTSDFWMFTIGVRLRAGVQHDRMGRYGVANP